MNIIIGSGISGLMMGYLLKRNYTIMDAAPAPRFQVNNPFYLHAPLDWLPTDWKQVDVHHNCWDGEQFHRAPNIKLMNDYARKITGKIIDTSLKFMDGAVKTGYMPAHGDAGKILRDLHDEVQDHVQWDSKLMKILPAQKAIVVQRGGEEYAYNYDNLISTVPLPVLLSKLDMPSTEKFQSEPIYTALYDVFDAAVECYQVIYITADNTVIHRASLMGKTIFLESMEPIDELEGQQLIWRLWQIRAPFRCSGVSRPGKFHPIDKTARKLLLARLTSEYGIMCLGRYAVWDYKRIDHISDDAHHLAKLIKTSALA